MGSSSPQVTRLLVEWSNGSDAALQALTPLVYDELRRLAQRFVRRERRGHTLQATALAHEAFLRLIDQRRVRWRDRAHFFAVAAQLMRRILVDHARRHSALKRSGPARTAPADGAAIGPDDRGVDMLALDEALQHLAAVDPRQSRLVELRFFGGLTIEEAAEVLGISPATVSREWTAAKAWLYRELHATEA